MTDLLFDAPWWLPTLLIGVGVVLFWNGNRRQEAKVRNAGLLAVLLGVAVMGVSYLVDTQAEKVEKQSVLLARSVERQDWTTLRNILSANTTVGVGDFGTLYATRDQIVDAAKQAVERYGVKNIRVLSSSFERSPSLITVYMTLYSEHEQSGRPITTSWQFDWEPSGKDWSLVHITCLNIGNVRGDAAARQFPPRR